MHLNGMSRTEKGQMELVQEFTQLCLELDSKLWSSSGKEVNMKEYTNEATGKGLGIIEP